MFNPQFGITVMSAPTAQAFYMVAGVASKTHNLESHGPNPIAMFRARRWRVKGGGRQPATCRCLCPVMDQWLPKGYL